MNDQTSAKLPAGPGRTAESASNADRERNAGAPASAKQTVGDIAAQASDQASSLFGQVTDKANDALSHGKDGLADRIDGIADAVHKSGAQFDGKQDWIAGAVERGASELGALATALRENDLSDLIGRVRDIARRQPALFIGASLAAGFAVARLGKIVAADVSRDDLPRIPEVGNGHG